MMEKQQIMQNIEARVEELTQTAQLKTQQLKAEFTQKIAEAQLFSAQLNNAKATIDNRLNNHQILLDSLDQLIDLRHEVADFEQMIEQDGEDIEKRSEAFQHRLQETVNVQLNALKTKVLTAQQETQDALLEAKTMLTGKSCKTAKYRQKWVDAFNAKFGDKLQKAKLILANQLENCAVKLKT